MKCKMPITILDILEYLDILVKKEPKVYFHTEVDSNESLFERRSNEREIGVLAYNDVIGTVLLDILHHISWGFVSTPVFGHQLVLGSPEMRFNGLKCFCRQGLEDDENGNLFESFNRNEYKEKKVVLNYYPTCIQDIIINFVGVNIETFVRIISDKEKTCMQVFNVNDTYYCDGYRKEARMNFPLVDIWTLERMKDAVKVIIDSSEN
jgi:hypothetical protein